METGLNETIRDVDDIKRTAVINNTFQVLLSPPNFKQRKNIPVLAGTTHRNQEYLEMRCNKTRHRP